MSRGFHINITVYVLCLVAVLGLWQSPLKAMELPSLGHFLNERGDLDFPEGYTGSVDTTGFEMINGLDGTPRFVSAGGDYGNSVAGHWETLGGLNFGCYGRVYSVAVMPSGIVYFGGNFTLCEDVAARSIVAYDPDSNTFMPLENDGQNGVSGSGNGQGAVRALAVSGTDLYVGGSFTLAGGQSVNRIARWDGSQWHALESGGQIGVSGGVNALTASGTDLYVGGTFTEAGGQTVNRIARWDGGQWHALESGGQIGVSGVSLYGYSGVRALAVSGTNLYVGGEFTEAGDQSANNVALWDGEQWHALESSGGNGVNYSVDALAVSGSDLYVGGSLYQAGGQSVNGIARWNGSQWHALDSGVGNFGTVNALVVAGTDVYVGGPFQFVDDGGQIANGIARWDGSQWHALEGGVYHGEYGFSVYSLAVSGADLFVGGNFTEAGGRSVNHVARWSDNQWHTLGKGEQRGMNSPVYTLEASGKDLYVGGSFTQAGNPDRNMIRVARQNGNQWHALGSGDQNGIMYVSVNALAATDAELYVGGMFTRAGSQSAECIARWDGSQWHALEHGEQNGVNCLGDPFAAVRALAVVGTDLYVGGHFYLAGEQPANNIARWDGSQWYTLGSDGQDGVYGGSNFPDGVWAMAISGTDLYVGGGFNHAGNQSAKNIARWDGEQWHALENGGENGVGGYVFDLAVSGTDLYVGGRFSRAGDQSANNIALWDGNQWYALGSGRQNGVTGDSASSVRALAFSGTDLYVGGAFTEAGGQSANNISLWDGSQWHALESSGQNGLNGTIHALNARGDVLHVGGSFTAAGGKLSLGFARFVVQGLLFRDQFEAGNPSPDSPPGFSTSVAGEND